MMRKFQNNEGFTLVELLVTILTGSIITMAATSVLIIGLRIYHKSMDTADRQSVMRITTSLLEALSSDGKVEVADSDEWEIKEVTRVSGGGTSEKTLISYSPDYDAIYAGESPLDPTEKTPLVEDVTDSSVVPGDTILDASEVPPLYKFKVELQGEGYETSVYCRTQDEKWYAFDPDLENEIGRKKFLEILGSQIGSQGQIDGVGDYFTQWYVENYTTDEFKPNSTNEKEWNPSTPWCSSFVSWAIDECTHVDIGAEDSVTYLNSAPSEASVNFLWLECYAEMGTENLKVYGDGYVPQPGDLIFFTDVRESGNEILTPMNNLEDISSSVLKSEMLLEKQQYWYISNQYVVDREATPLDSLKTKLEWETILDKTKYEPYSVMKHFIGITGDGLDHVGVVIKVDGDYVYTIEGNVSVNNIPRVIMRKFPRINPTDSFIQDEYLRIFGYVSLDWI